MPGRRMRRSVFGGIAMLTVLAIATGCAAASPKTVAITPGDRPNADTVALPAEQAALVDAAVKRLPDLITDGLTRTGVPGLAVAVVSGDQVVYSGGFGVKDTRTGAPVDTDTVFQIASLSKPLSATVVAKAVGDGTVTWDTPVQREMPTFTLADPYVTANATIADYFTHRSGLPTDAGDDLEDLGFDRATILDRLHLIPLAPFRSTYQYSNFGLTTGAEALAAARGETWEQTADQLLFQPLGMTSTSSSHADFLAAPDHAVLHVKTGDRTFEPLFDRDPDAEAPAGGDSSTVGDIATWMRLILDGGKLNGQQYLDPAALLAMTSAQIVNATGPTVDNRPGHYGYGIGVGSTAAGRVTLSHSGAFGSGAATTATLVPSLGLGIVVLTNAAPVGLPEAITQEFLDLVQYGDLSRDWVDTLGQAFARFAAPSGDLAGEQPPANAALAAPASAYVGTYTSPYFGNLVVTESGGRLQGAMGPTGGYTFAIDPWNGDTLSFVPTGEGALPGSQSSATFVRAGDQATQVTLQYFDKFGLGTFTRVS
ncbi:serine hydrolase [Microbacterium sp. X-17]|uniref:serine hydrolase n=1 Tax=Microbacterium sp. X-17 TaxID=3144404 RepID=UPI0031F509C9